jgi:hypothetical protein
MSTQGCLFFHQGIEDGCVLTMATSSIPDHAPAMQAYNNTLQHIDDVLSMTSSWNANFTPVVYILPIWSPGIKVINIGRSLSFYEVCWARDSLGHHHVSESVLLLVWVSVAKFMNLLEMVRYNINPKWLGNVQLITLRGSKLIATLDSWSSLK